jgi:hypothetical protein
MIKSFSSMSHLLHAIAQEGAADPGKGLTALQTFTYFVGVPVALFAIIGGLAWISGRDKRAVKRDVINSID